MPQHDYNLANAAGATFRGDVNSALAAIVSNNSGGSAPSTLFAYMWWADTGTGLMKQRNAANDAWITLFPLALGPGKVVQVVNTSSSALGSGITTQIPFDDTIPQNTEGGEVLTRAITPSNASNLLKIEVRIQFGQSAAGDAAIALFQDSTASALKANSVNYNGDSNGIHGVFVLEHWMVAGTTSSTTFKARIGPCNATTVYMNGVPGGTRVFGGVAGSSITITEIAA